MVSKLPRGSFFGRAEGRQQFAGIIILESVYHDELAIPPHEHACAFFDFVVGGGCTEVIRGQSRTRDPWTLAFHPAGEVHSSCWHGRESRCFHIEIPHTLIDRVREDSPGPLDAAVFRGAMPVWLARRLNNEFHRMDECSPMVIEGLTLELLAECARSRSRTFERRPPRWLVSVLEILQEDYRAPLSLGSIGAQVGIHPAHLARVFRQFQGCTLGEHVRRLRLELASRLLTSSHQTLVEIALGAGFADQSHFSRVFKRQTGFSPAAFRELARERKSGPKKRSDRERT